MIVSYLSFISNPSTSSAFHLCAVAVLHAASSAAAAVLSSVCQAVLSCAANVNRQPSAFHLRTVAVLHAATSAAAAAAAAAALSSVCQAALSYAAKGNRHLSSFLCSSSLTCSHSSSSRGPALFMYVLSFLQPLLLPLRSQVGLCGCSIWCTDQVPPS